jgi:hypothetical protein
MLFEVVMIEVLKVIVSVFVGAFVLWGVIDYIIQRVSERDKTNKVKGGNGNPPNRCAGGQQTAGAEDATEPDNPKDIRCKIIQEPKELRIYGMLPYNFYILSLASLFGVYLMFHGVREDVRSLYEIVNMPKNKVVGDDKRTGDSCRCKKDICADVKAGTTPKNKNDNKGK